MGRPRCGMCRTRNSACTYSKWRKKPGPKRSATNKSTTSANGPSNLGLPSVDIDTPDPFNFDYVHDGVGTTTTQEHSSLWLSEGVDAVTHFNEMWCELSPMPALSTFGFDASVVLTEGFVLEPRMESYLFELYLEHLQPIYPLLRRSYSAFVMSNRLKMAICAVSSRFASQGALANSVMKAADFAKQARDLEPNHSAPLTLEEVKSSFLLCLYDLQESITWRSVAEIAKLSRLVEVYLSSQLGTMNKRSGALDDGKDVGVSAFGDTELLGRPVSAYESEERTSLWWSLFHLDTCYSAFTLSPHTTTTHMEDSVCLPTVSVCEFTNDDGSLQPAVDCDVSESTSLILNESACMAKSCRSRVLNIRACILMRTVTEFRMAIRLNPGFCMRESLREVESNVTAMGFSLPPWVFNPTRNFAVCETEEDHQSRLNMLLVWYGARLLLEISATVMGGNGLHGYQKEAEQEKRWRAIYAEANEIISVIQSWKVRYFAGADSMSCYIVFLAASILILNHKLKNISMHTMSGVANHVNLLILWIGQMSQIWTLAAPLQGLSPESLLPKESEANITTVHLRNFLAMPANQTYEEILSVSYGLTKPLGAESFLSKDPQRRSWEDRPRMALSSHLTNIANEPLHSYFESTQNAPWGLDWTTDILT
ncbi:hypothetical protein IQ07DRAFT_678188 [Pyrenochaeta sp. DS3sAY3a]|nr:hypothetical protein IQ07DRAFT_678188 [Pyrenochaeta sp. DS3sAY3a]